MASFFASRPHRFPRRPRNRLSVEVLEQRCVLSGSGLSDTPLLHEVEPGDTLLQASHIGTLTQPTNLTGVIGNSAAGAADVDWFDFTLAEPATVTLGVLDPLAYRPVISLYNDVPFDFADPFAQLGVRQLDQSDGSALVRTLAAGLYHVAISGAGNRYFNPFLADSGLAGSTGTYEVSLGVETVATDLADGPILLGSEPANGAQLASSPFVLRLTFSTAPNVDTIIPGSTVFLTYNPTGTFGDGQDQDIWIDTVNVNSANELQIVPGQTLAWGFYRLVLAGDTESNWEFATDLAGVPLGTDALHPAGQDAVLTFEVNGNEGDPTSFGADDTAATAHDLGDVTQVGLVQRSGAIGDDSSDFMPFNPADVDMYHFSITGPGSYAVFVEVFARRMGSPLNPGVSLFRLDPTDGQLHLVAGNDDTQNQTEGVDGNLQLFADSGLMLGLTAGDYYLAVTSRKNVPDPLRGLLPGVDGIFDPNVSQSGTAGISTGPYVLNLLVQADDVAPRVVSVSVPDGGFTAPPTQFVVGFSEGVNLQTLAFQAYQQTSQSALQSVYVEAADGTRYYPRLISYDAVTNRATFQMLDGLANGAYALHLSGPLGLADFAGNPLRGEGAGGDCVVDFTVAGPERGSDGDPLTWVAGAGTQEVGVLFPHELQTGVLFTRDATSPVDQLVDRYRFTLLQDQSYFFLLSGANTANLIVTLRDAAGDEVITAPQGSGLLALLRAGTYILEVRGWPAGNPTPYQMKMNLGAASENPPPLTVGPSPTIRYRLTPTPANDTAPPQVVLSPSTSASPAQTSVSSIGITPVVGSGGSSTRSPSLDTSLLFSTLATGPIGGVTSPNSTVLAGPTRVVVLAPESPLNLSGLLALTLIPILSNESPAETDELDLNPINELFMEGVRQLDAAWMNASHPLELFTDMLDALMSTHPAEEAAPLDEQEMSRLVPERTVSEPTSFALLALLGTAALVLPHAQFERRSRHDRLRWLWA